MVQLQSARERFVQAGLGIGAISYDNPAILKEFAERRGIEYSLLADPESEIIRRFRLTDVTPGPVGGLPPFVRQGMPVPGYFVVDRNGIVRERLFGAYFDRFTPQNLMAKLFPELLETLGPTVQAPRLQIVMKVSDRDVIASNRITLGVEVTVPDGTHVYAPGEHGYQAIDLAIDSVGDSPAESGLLRDLAYPLAAELVLPVTGERLPTYEGRFTISQDVVIKTPASLADRVKAGETVPLEVRGRLRYQTCDASACHVP